MSTSISEYKCILKDLHFAEENVENCNSWGEFSKRVSSFLTPESQWRLKPFCLSPPACAQYGWKCIGKDLIECVACNKIICGKLPVIWNSNVYDVCVNAIIKSLKTSHNKYCPWPVAPCPDNFVQIVPIDKKQAFCEFMGRLETLLQIKEELPLIKNETLERDITEDDQVHLSQLVQSELNIHLKSAIILALTGWRKAYGEKKCLWCCHCQRSLELQFYKTAKIIKSDVDNESDNADPVNVAEDKIVNSVKSNQVNESKDDGASSLIETEMKDDLEKYEDKFKVKGVKNNNNSEIKTNLDDETNEPPKKIQKIEKKNTPDYFDPVFEHRYWCMWTSSTNAFNKNKYGWQIFLKSLLLNVKPSSVSSKCVKLSEKMKSIHQMLENWT